LLLQITAQKIGVTVDTTLKSYCELAGEGTEYSWSCAKRKYECLPIKEKIKETFK
jgi:hypothetical protein